MQKKYFCDKMKTTLKYKNKNMSFEKQNEGKDSIQENKEKFDKSFENELQDPNFDTKAFWNLISWIPYDDKISKEENLKNAFDAKISTLVDQNLKNLTPENKAELEALKQKASDGLKDPKEIVDAFSEIQSEINNRNWESAKAGQDLQNKNNEANTKKLSKELQDFVDKLKISLDEQQKARDSKAQEIKQAQEIEKIERQQGIEKASKDIDKISSTKEQPQSQTA